uniref:Vacuolar ATPase assembly integral membrane protein VMA21 homolog n=1 Tax=Oryza glumipatula TaxID=40148 RepID=A0A0D9ZQJ7_9ORYZ
MFLGRGPLQGPSHTVAESSSSSSPLLLLCSTREDLGEVMSGVLAKFAIASAVMWTAPVAIVYGFYYQMIPGVSQLSSSTQTLASGFLAVISINLVIGFYICMAMKETPHQEPQPDPTFLANAKASIDQPTPSQVNDDSHGKGKEGL